MEKYACKGFTLMEMMITVAIIGILAAIALPSYNRYIERGYLSQAQAEFVDFNNNFKTMLVKNPSLDNDTIATKLKEQLSEFNASPDLAGKYDYAARLQSSAGRRYILTATPKTGSGYTLVLWMDSLGNAYRCSDAASAENPQQNSSACEKI